MLSKGCDQRNGRTDNEAPLTGGGCGEGHGHSRRRGQDQRVDKRYSSTDGPCLADVSILANDEPNTWSPADTSAVSFSVSGDKERDWSPTGPVSSSWRVICRRAVGVRVRAVGHGPLHGSR
jgi:hypothetical protein